jgi:hypothetical protein
LKDFARTTSTGCMHAMSGVRRQSDDADVIRRKHARSGWIGIEPGVAEAQNSLHTRFHADLCSMSNRPTAEVPRECSVQCAVGWGHCTIQGAILGRTRSALRTTLQHQTTWGQQSVVKAVPNEFRTAP